VHYGDSTTWLLRCKPASFEELTIPVRLVSDSSFCETFLIVSASGVGPTPNGATLPLQHSSSDIIAVESNSDLTHRQFYFRNDSIGSVTIDTLIISNAPSFTIDSLPRFPLVISPLASFPLSLAFRRSSTGSENGFLVSKPIHTPITFGIKFSLQGLRVADFGGVESSPSASTHVWIYPNPAHGPIVVHTQGLTHTHVQIMDVLGIPIQESGFEGDWKWDGNAGDGHKALSGTYFVIVSGVNSFGEAVREVRPLLVQ
jgi:hypothetical protein